MKDLIYVCIFQVEKELQKRCANNLMCASSSVNSVWVYYEFCKSKLGSLISKRISIIHNLYFFESNSFHLKSCGESIKSCNCLSVSSSTCISLPQSSSSVGCLDSLEENISLLLLLDGRSKSANSSTSLVHVTGKLVLHVEPFLLLNICWDLAKTDLGLCKNSLLAVEVLSIVFGVDSILSSYLSVYRVRRVNLGALVSSVSSSLRVGGSVSDNSENRETRGLSNSSVSSNRKESSSSSSDLSESLTTSFGVDSSGYTCVISLFN